MAYLFTLTMTYDTTLTFDSTSASAIAVAGTQRFPCGNHKERDNLLSVKRPKTNLTNQQQLQEASLPVFQSYAFLHFQHYFLATALPVVLNWS